MPQNPKPKFKLTHLYSKEMSIYGDIGNVIAIRYRIEKYGLDFVYQPVGVGQELPEESDFYFMGGGQDVEQIAIYKDLKLKSKKIIQDVTNNTPALLICGGYQLFGEKFITGNGQVVAGLGFFPVITKAPDSSVKSRCIGNLVAECLIPELKNCKLVGFENHSGQTYFHNQQQERQYSLARVICGNGNVYKGKHEGCIVKNAIGTYMHGSCLPKNPELADHLIFQALRTMAENKKIDPQQYLSIRKKSIDDEIAFLAKDFVIKKFCNRKVTT